MADFDFFIRRREYRFAGQSVPMWRFGRLLGGALCPFGCCAEDGYAQGRTVWFDLEPCRLEDASDIPSDCKK